MKILKFSVFNNSKNEALLWSANLLYKSVNLLYRSASLLYRSVNFGQVLVVFLIK
jgi:hypothetical protein